MKSVIRNTSINALALFVIPKVIDGVKITGGIETYLFGGFCLFLMSLILKPILNLITLPLNFLTFGSFSFITNIAILYLLTVFVSQISITSFAFQGFSFDGFIIPKIYFNTLFAFIVSAFVLSLIISLIQWLIKK